MMKAPLCKEDQALSEQLISASKHPGISQAHPHSYINPDVLIKLHPKEPNHIVGLHEQAVN